MTQSAILDLGSLHSPVLIFGGPYSNLAATKAMLQQADKLDIPPQQIICSGDVVAYCAEPDQTCSLLKQAGIRVLMGNCEESIVQGSDDCGCGFEEGMLCSTLSEQWYRYASSQISTQNRDWMSELPSAIRFDLQGIQCHCVHGSVTQINQFLFASSSNQFKQQQIDKALTDVVIGGHCGLPFGQILGSKAWLNAGVIGLPANDGTQSTWYMMMSPESAGIRVSWHRLEYQVEQSVQSMREVGLTTYADSLETGLWPSMDILPELEKSRQGQAIELQDLFIHNAPAV